MHKDQLQRLLLLVASVARARPAVAPWLIAKNLGKLQRLAVSFRTPERVEPEKLKSLVQHACILGAELNTWVTVKDCVTYLNLDGSEFIII